MERLFVCSGDPGARLQVRQPAGKVQRRVNVTSNAEMLQAGWSI
jgi:hypothetical protein